MDCSPPGSSILDSPGKNTGAGCHFLLQGNLPDPGIKLAILGSSAMAGGFFTTEPPGKPHDTKSGVKNIYPFYFGQMASIFCFSF